jgi:hypothetical protein
MTRYALKFPKDVADKLALTTRNGVAKVTPFDLAAALTQFFGKPYSPDGLGEDLRTMHLAQAAARGAIAGGNWRLKAYHSGLNGFVHNHASIHEKQAAAWLSCLMFIYFNRYGKTDDYHTDEMAYGFGAFLTLRDVARISELPDVLYAINEGEPPPTLLDHTILMYLELTEDDLETQHPKQPPDGGVIEIYFDQEERK